MIENNLNINTGNKINNINTNVKPDPILNNNPINPAKVNKPMEKGQEDLLGNNKLTQNTNSAYIKFLQALKNSPVLSEGAKKLLLNKSFMQGIKSDSVLSALFDKFLDDIKMNDTEIVEFLKFQNKNFTKFGGEFFNILRNLISTNKGDAEFKLIVRNFLKSYDCFVSVDETSKSISTILKNIEENIPELLKRPFLEMTGKLSLVDYKSDLDLLRNEILPFMGRYISKMKDFGVVKDYTSLLIHNMVRLEAGLKSNFTSNLDNLFDYLRFNCNYSKDDINKLQEILINDSEKLYESKPKALETFLKLIESGAKESKNASTKLNMEEMTESILFSRNVDIPLTHILLPLNYNGVFMFSEMWVSKEYWETKDKDNNVEYVENYKLFITFDIDNMGHFESILNMQKEKLSLKIYVPNSISNSIGKIKQDLLGVLNKNGMSLVDLEVYELKNKRRFNEVFSNILERKTGINVTI